MKVFLKDGAPLAHIYGYSYPARSVIENMTTHYVKQDHASVYHIGMLHGSIEGNKDHDVYCPFKVNELINKDFDYWALGHIHKRQLLHESNPIIAYSGNIQGRHRKESGEKGFYLVEMNEEASTASFISTEEVIWTDAEVSVEGLHNVSELIQKCEEIIGEIRQSQRSTCLTICFIGTGDLASSLDTSQTVQDIMDALNDDEGDSSRFVWVVKILNKTHQNNENNPKLTSFFTDLHTTVENYHSFAEVTQPLMQHPIYRKYIEEFTLEEQQQLLKEAERLLHNELLKQSGVKER